MDPAFERILAALPDAAPASTVAHGILVLEIEPAAIVPVARTLKSLGFDMLSDTTAVDRLPREPRFDVVWHFYSTTAHVRVRVRTRVPEASPVVDSLVPLYNAARFIERECHEMYGIVFAGNADLRPLLLYEGFVGHPLRKDYAKGHEQPLVPYLER